MGCEKHVPSQEVDGKLDDGSGVVQVWRVIDFDVAEPVPEEEIGNFHTW